MKSFLEAEGTIKYTLQNEVIESCNKIVTNINSQRCFIILADETAHISGIKQVSLCARYLDVENMIIKEEFLQFMPTTDTTGKGLADIIIQILHSYGIETKYLRGHYDGCASMSGQFNGVQAIIRQSFHTCDVCSLCCSCFKPCSFLFMFYTRNTKLFMNNI